MADDKSKKRKRLSNGIDEPNKRVASQKANTDQIVVHFRSHNGAHPVVVSSPGLETPLTSFNAYVKSLSGENTNNKSPTPATHDLLLHSSKHPRLDYTAAPASLDQHLSHYVAVFDPATKQLQIQPAHHLNLRRTLRTEAKEEDEKRKRTFAQQRAELGREFGTKKAKKIIADKTVNAIVKGTPGKGTDSVQDAILDAMAETAIPTLDEQAKVEAALASKPIPKPNLAAEELEDVYTFDTLVPKSDARLVSIKEWQESVQNDEKVNDRHRFPVTRVVSLGKSDYVLRLKAMRYLALLLDFHDVLQNAGRTGKKVPKKEVLQEKLSAWPESLVDSVRRRFANASNELPKWHMDNLYTHMCALSLYVDGWTTDVMHLKLDLRMENKEITQYFRELGCAVARPTDEERKTLNNWKSDFKVMSQTVASQTRVAKLRLPLDFPQPRAGRKR